MNAIGFATDNIGDLAGSREAREIAENRLAALQAGVEATALERTRTLIESPQPVPVPWAEYPQFDEFNQWPSAYERPYYWSSLDDRTEGRYLPYYETDQDLKRMRASARKLQALFPVAEGALESLTNYIIGSGYEFTAVAKQSGAESLAASIQRVIDRFLDINDFSGELDREIHDRTRVDGEAFPTLYPDERAGEVLIDVIEPDNILQPARPEPLERMLGLGHKLSYWYLGVHTLHCQQRKRDHAEQPLGYHAVFDRHGEQWDYLPASRVEHIKRNVGRTGRHGASDFLIVQRDLESEAKIRRNTAEGVAILAAIVMVRQHPEGVTKSSIESMVASNATASYERQTQNSSRTTSVEQTRPGTVKDIPYGMNATLGPLGTLRSPVYIEVAQYLLRIIGHRWNMPEYLVSGDASNANYSSTLVAESPFVKAREHDQKEYARHFRRLIWKALRLYHGMRVFGRGLSWQQITGSIEIKVDYPAVASRDKLQQAQVNQVLSDAGIMSKRTWAVQSDLDYDEEQKEIAGGASDEGGAGALETVQLNGLQVTAASEILHQVATGDTAELVAVGLLQSIGIPPGLARRMVVASAAKSAEIQAKERQKNAQQNPFGKPSPFPLPQREPTGSQPQRESYLAIRAIETLLDRSPAQLTESRDSAPSAVELVEAIGTAMKAQPPANVTVQLPPIEIPPVVVNTPEISIPATIVNVPAPIVNIPAAPAPPEYDIEPVRDPKTKLVTRFKRVRKKD